MRTSNIRALLDSLHYINIYVSIPVTNVTIALSRNKQEETRILCTCSVELN